MLLSGNIAHGEVSKWCRDATPSPHAAFGHGWPADMLISTFVSVFVPADMSLTRDPQDLIEGFQRDQFILLVANHPSGLTK
jgi:hypothetical protein